ncbi:MAG: type III polyketide synthase [bacterium]|nr:type III polyketide synthase [bacterium]
MPVYINHIGTAVPNYQLTQEEAAEFMTEALQMEGRDKKKLKYLYRQTGITSRASVIEDYGKEVSDFEFFPKNKTLSPMPTVGERMRLYEKYALGLCVKAIENTVPKNFDFKKITHLITVSCTGMYAPGIDVELVVKLGMNTSVKRTAINFMGCYGAFNAIKTAQQICSAQEDANVLIVAVELCTIHFQGNETEDNLLTNALFADGAAAVVVTNSENGNPALTLENFYSDLVYQGKDEMVWKINDFGFEMRLTSLVPEYIKSGIKELTDNLLEFMSLKVSDIDFFAIHPGGKRILEVIEEVFSLSKNDNRFAYDVLTKYGNMSSPTVLFVLKQILDSVSEEDHDKSILSFAFGPGLTLESMLLKTHCK